MNTKRYMVALCSLLLSTSMVAQQEMQTTTSKQQRKRSFEIGLMGSLVNLNHVAPYAYEKGTESHKVSLGIDKVIGGGGLYLAAEMNPWFYLDLQGTVNAAKFNKDGKYQLMYMVGPGVQLRLGRLLGSRYLEPYLRAGINYLHTDIEFKNKDNVPFSWSHTDTWNASAKKSKQAGTFPISLGAGLLGWLNDYVGLGLQGEYLLATQKDAPQFVQITGRLAFRIGGETKLVRSTVVNDVDRVVEQIREVETVVEKFREDGATKKICNLLDGVVFDFDQDVITATSNDVLDKVADILKMEDSSARFLLIGYTDARGTKAYNKDLSERRAKAVYDALLQRGVAAEMLTYHGVGKGAAVVPASTSHAVREGDRKVTIERVRNMEYWDVIKR